MTNSLLISSAPPSCMERTEWPEDLWAFHYDDDTYFCLWNCIAVVSSRSLAVAFLEALKSDEKKYRGARIIEISFDEVRDQAVARDCDGLILVDVPERPRRFFVR